MSISERKEREKLKRREDILDAAAKIFFSKGIHNSTMDDVAAEAELSKGTLYLYFKSKEEIHWEITQRHFKKVSSRMEEAMDDNNTAIENLLIMAKVFIDHIEEEHEAAQSIFFFQACDISNLKLDPEQLNHAFLNDSPIHLVTRNVERGIKEGMIRDDISVNALSSTLWAQLLGVLQIVATERDFFELIHVSKEDIIESHIKIALNGITKQ